MSVHRAILLAGGNRGDVAAAMERVAALLEERAGHVAAMSRIYFSEPWGFEAEGRFQNRAFVVETYLKPERLLDITQQIEREMGLQRDGRVSGTGSDGREVRLAEYGYRHDILRRTG